MAVRQLPGSRRQDRRAARIAGGVAGGFAGRRRGRRPCSLRRPRPQSHHALAFVFRARRPSVAMRGLRRQRHGAQASGGAARGAGGQHPHGRRSLAGMGPGRFRLHCHSAGAMLRLRHRGRRRLRQGPAMPRRHHRRRSVRRRAACASYASDNRCRGEQLIVPPSTG